MQDFPEPLPHGEITEVFPDVFFVVGQSKFEIQGNIAQFTRSMTVIRDDDSLTLANTLRLDDEGLQALDRLGKVENIIRLAANHGRDDAFYSDRYDAPVWALEGAAQARPVKNVATLIAGDSGPVNGATTMVYESIAAAEAVLCVHRRGGILVAGDSLQNLTGPNEFFDDATAETLQKGGFFKRGNIGPAWRANLQPERSDFDRILALEFKHLLPAHGDPLLDEAREVIGQTVEEIYSS
ncbi:MAG: hypothetical protein GY952_14800 [Rhodobacteraceae bacterium]|nr:hypothetical protein [Paracoccaceae bacterium]